MSEPGPVIDTSALPVARFQILTEPSHDADTGLPSERKTRALTTLKCPVRGFPGASVSTFHNLMVPDPMPRATVLPSGENATASKESPAGMSALLLLASTSHRCRFSSAPNSDQVSSDPDGDRATALIDSFRSILKRGVVTTSGLSSSG